MPKRRGKCRENLKFRGSPRWAVLLLRGSLVLAAPIPPQILEVPRDALFDLLAGGGHTRVLVARTACLSPWKPGSTESPAVPLREQMGQTSGSGYSGFFSLILSRSDRRFSI